jgi:multidrug efflux system membrane fusion protein
MDQDPPASQSSMTFQRGPDENPNSARRRHVWVWLVVLLIFGLLFYWVIHEHGKAQAATRSGGRRGAMSGPVPVSPATAQSGSIGVYLNAIGTVTPVYTAQITAQVTGVITAVHYREGQYVRKGDPLIDIDARQYEAQVQQAEGLLERDKNLLAEAQMDLERYKQAWSKNAIPRQTLEDQEKTVLQDQGTVKNDEGTLAYDKVQVSYCHIASPINGRVGLRLVDPGNLVTANSTTTLVVVTQIQPITVIFTVSEDNLGEVLQNQQHGKQLTVEAYDRAQEHLLSTGTLTTVDNQIDTTSGTVKLRARFDNRDGTLFPNQFVNTRLLVRTLTNQTLIPSSAVQHNGTQDFVFVLSGGKAQLRTVKTGQSDHGETTVQGVNPGDVVANSSFEKLQNGAPVSISKVQIPATSDSPENNVP